MQVIKSLAHISIDYQSSEACLAPPPVGAPAWLRHPLGSHTPEDGASSPSLPPWMPNGRSMENERSSEPPHFLLGTIAQVTRSITQATHVCLPQNSLSPHSVLQTSCRVCRGRMFWNDLVQQGRETPAEIRYADEGLREEKR